ncbi:TetR/AcrR family transcriptional regulator [Streptomyces sp. ITFR-6]|uniref:TetR/AcrR family transcriptional regulator n=1 Tax=Streptomyces sp. ITFR-6 TaxID=3075197 RepID=UPI002889AE9A|nr:TetR/AcrR family transcriptional regulator [Streptomyces sp. ITFR-6]WNI28234.1 TetR/AcrR family transcriptional regulator [Streptomyces sp. ITFR-6]
MTAVQRLLVEWGSPDKLTMRAVAKEVGISAPSIYLHFADKSELVWAALADRYEELVAQMTAATDDAPEPRARLQAQARAYCLFALNNAGHYQLMFEVRQPTVAPSKISHHPARHVSASLRAGIRQCQNSGYIVTQPVEQAAQTLWAGLHGTVSLHHSFYRGESSEALVLLLADGLIDSLVTSAPGSRPGHEGAAETAASRHIREILTPADPSGPDA